MDITMVMAMVMVTEPDMVIMMKINQELEQKRNHSLEENKLTIIIK